MMKYLRSHTHTLTLAHIADIVRQFGIEALLEAFHSSPRKTVWTINIATDGWNKVIREKKGWFKQNDQIVLVHMALMMAVLEGVGGVEQWSKNLARFNWPVSQKKREKQKKERVLNEKNFEN